MTTPQTQPTPEQWADTLEKLARDKALPSLWPEDCLAIAATLRAQAAALAEREAECERVRALLPKWDADAALDPSDYYEPSEGYKSALSDCATELRAALTQSMPEQHHKVPQVGVCE